MNELMKTGEEVLDLPIVLTGEREEHRLADGGQELATVRDYLCEILALVWRGGTTGGVMNSFGSNWQEPVYAALVRAEIVGGREHLQNGGAELASLWYWMDYLLDAEEYVTRAVTALAGKS